MVKPQGRLGLHHRTVQTSSSVWVQGTAWLVPHSPLASERAIFHETTAVETTALSRELDERQREMPDETFTCVYIS